MEACIDSTPCTLGCWTALAYSEPRTEINGGELWTQLRPRSQEGLALPDDDDVKYALASTMLLPIRISYFYELLPIYVFIPVQCCVGDELFAISTKLCLQDSLTRSSDQIRRRSRAPWNSAKVWQTLKQLQKSRVSTLMTSHATLPPLPNSAVAFSSSIMHYTATIKFKIAAYVYVVVAIYKR